MKEANREGTLMWDVLKGLSRENATQHDPGHENTVEGPVSAHLLGFRWAFMAESGK